MKSDGFTLVELLITVTIIGIVAALAAPSFNESIRQHQVRSAAENYYSLLRYSRAEAARSGRQVVVSPLTGNDWSSGIVATQNGQEIRRNTPSANLSIVENNTINQFIINGRGYLSAEVTFRICRTDNNSEGRDVHMLRSGFARVSETGGC